MSKLRPVLLGLAVIAAATIGIGQANAASTKAPAIIEVVTLTYKPGTSVETFRAADHDVETQHVSRQPGFLSRESAPGKDNSWVVIVHWRSIKDAQASMDSFEKAPAAARFMSLIVPGTMQMTRYGGAAH